MTSQTILHYQIEEKLGEGGMGVVYKAKDTKLDRYVALKFLPAHLSASEQDKARFIQEAKAASALNHPNVCTIHDIQEFEGQLFIVMELVDGQTLREKKGNLSLKQAVDIGIQIADGLAAAHEKGIVHRDIKPENIMIRKDGIVQVMDFGLAKLRGNVTRLTKEGSTVGTAGYMSPEQIQGQETDHRSDIFSLGVLIYELFTGQLPFRGVHETALAYEIVNVDPEPMSKVKPEIDPALDAIVLECLEKDVNERTQSTKQLSIDLKRFKRESSRQRATRTLQSRSYPVPIIAESGGIGRKLNQWLWPMVSGVLLVVLLLLLWKGWRSQSAPVRPVTRFSLDLSLFYPLAGGNSGLTLSPDGKYLVYIGTTPNSTQLFLRRMDQLTVTPIPGTQGADEPAFSPDGQWIVFWMGQTLKKVSIFGGAPEDLCNTQGITRGVCWAEDHFVYYGHISSGIYRVSEKGGTPEQVTVLDTSAGEISHRSPQILPGGKEILFTIKQNNISTFDEAIIAVERLETKVRKIVVRGGAYGRYVPTGHLLYVRGNSIYAAPFDKDRLEVTGPPAPIEEGGWLNRGSGQANISFSNTGTLAFVPLGSLSFENVLISWMDRQGRTTPLIDSLRAYYYAILSPDGEKLALGVNAANDDIWVYHLARKTLTRLTFGGGNNGFPVWTPDGKSLVYQAEKGKAPNIFRKSWDGSGTEERLTRDANPQIPFSFTPDGKLLTFEQNGDIWILPMEGDRKPWTFIQSPANEGGAVFSPDGHWLAYVSDESGKNEVYVVPFPKHDGKWQISNGGGTTPIWSRNGRELFYTNGPSLMAVEILTRTTFDFSTPHKLCNIPSATSVYDVSPNGQKFVVSTVRSLQLTSTRVDIVLEWFEDLKNKLAGFKNQ